MSNFERVHGRSERVDAVVIGGGPGGSVAATLLARGGCRVALLERESFPRDHVGESLLPASIPVLESLGVLAQVERAGFPKKWGATMVWGRERAPWSWRFQETNRSYPHAYQVWRPTFDKILLDNARAAGVDVREEYAATAPLTTAEDGGRVEGVRFRASNGRSGALEAEWVVDASGQAAVLGRAMRLRRWDDYFRNMAVYAYFDGARRLPSPNETNIFIESYEHGWAWNIPLSEGAASVGVVVDSERGQRGISSCGVNGYYMRQIEAAAHTKEMLDGARMLRAPQVVKDWSYTSSKMAGDGWLLVGDAACFVDPLFSSGVHLAMMSAVMGAAYIDAAGRDASLRAPAARVYERMFRSEYSHFRELARLFYASNRAVESYFWEARRLLGASEDEDSRKAFIRAVAGQAPRGYERAVLDRGHVPDSAREAIREIEADRRARADALGFESIMSAKPSMAAGARIERMPIFADGEFQWSEALISPQRPEGVPVSRMVAALVSEIDGRTAARDLAARLSGGIASAEERRAASRMIVETLRILAVEGAVTL